MDKSVVVLGLDTGNGYVKGKFMGIPNEQDGKQLNIDVPTCVAGIPEPPQVPQEATDAWMADIFNKMLVQFHSPLVRDNRYFTFGCGAINSGRNLIEFDIATSNLSKAQQDLSFMISLGMSAGVALRNYWNTYHELPTDILDVDVILSLALPIDEYTRYREMFQQKFLSGVHEITICNFDKPVHIRLTYRTVDVSPEGVSAQYAITEKGELFAQALLDDVRSRDANALKDVTAKDVINCMNTCGIDIGEGTVNLPVIKNGYFETVASATIQKGYGSILEQALPRISQANMPYDSRKKLANFMLEPTTVFNKNKKTTVNDIVASESVDLVDAICRNVAKILSGGGIDIIYVYGGGATPLKPFLYDALIEKSRNFAGGDAFPILYLDSSYARNLNREGLYTVALYNYNLIYGQKQSTKKEAATTK